MMAITEQVYTIHHRTYDGDLGAVIERQVSEADLGARLGSAIKEHGYLLVCAVKQVTTPAACDAHRSSIPSSQERP